MQASKRKAHKPAGLEEGRVEQALGRIAEEKLKAAQQEQAADAHIHSDMQRILNRMGDAANEDQFYHLMSEAISTHQKGWESLAAFEKKIREMKKF